MASFQLTKCWENNKYIKRVILDAHVFLEAKDLERSVQNFAKFPTNFSLENMGHKQHILGRGG